MRVACTPVGVRVHVHRLTVVQHGELAGDRARVGRAEDDVDGERLVLALPRRRGEALDEHLVLHVVVAAASRRSARLRDGGVDGGVEVAGRRVAVAHQQQAVHRVALNVASASWMAEAMSVPLPTVADRAGVERRAACSASRRSAPGRGSRSRRCDRPASCPLLRIGRLVRTNHRRLC